MSLIYHPKVGDIVMCEFPSCFQSPEMVKTRPVVVISPKIPGRTTMVAIVPLSTTAPMPRLGHHCEIALRMLPPSLQASASTCWAKCDMVYTFSIHRLSLVQGKRDPKTQKRRYETARLDLAHIQAVRRCLASALGITNALWGDEENQCVTAAGLPRSAVNELLTPLPIVNSIGPDLSA